MKDGTDFSGSCHFLCTLFNLTFCLWPLWLPANHMRRQREPSVTYPYYATPLSPHTCPSYPLSLPGSLPDLRESIVSDFFFFYFSFPLPFSFQPLTSPHLPTIHPIAFVSPGKQKHLLPLTWYVCSSSCAWMKQTFTVIYYRWFFS